MFQELKIFLLAYSGELFMEFITLVGIWFMLKFQLNTRLKKYDEKFLMLQQSHQSYLDLFAEFRGKVKGKISVLFRLINNLERELHKTQIELRHAKMYGSREIKNIKDSVEFHERTLNRQQTVLDELLLARMGLLADDAAHREHKWS